MKDAEEEEKKKEQQCILPERIHGLLGCMVSLQHVSKGLFIQTLANCGVRINPY